ncbi:hypothetical protein J5500_03305 [Candidatus Saccharibacteria bacterium]|nr:hypothetical protein [Candidatus Saccharibacteria bacterium]
MRLLEVIKTHYKAILVGVVVLALVTTGIFIAVDAAKTAKINILVTPVDAVVKIDGRRFSNGNHRVFPGKKHVEITRSGMEPVNFDIDCVSEHTVVINRYLVGANNNFSEYTKSAESYELLKLLADEKVADFINKEEQKLTIKDLLPINKTSMLKKNTYAKDSRPYIETKISEIVDSERCKSSICLSVKTNANNAKTTAKSILESYGYDIDDFEVYYEE